MNRDDTKVVIITGAARGLGRDYAAMFAADGYNVVLADIKGAETAARAAAEHGTRTLSVTADVTDRASVRQLMSQAMAEFGRIDVLVNNAGLWRTLVEHGLLGCTEDLWKAAWSVNVTGTLFCYQEAVPIMRDAGGGRIINVSSMAARSGRHAYGLTKAAVEHMTAGMAFEVGGDGITVNCIAPGICTFSGAKSHLPELDAIVARNAIKRPGTSAELYGAMRYLCSDAAAYVTGQTIKVDGGVFAA